jgi:hypothetical protein
MSQSWPVLDPRHRWSGADPTLLLLEPWYGDGARRVRAALLTLDVALACASLVTVVFRKPSSGVSDPCPSESSPGVAGGTNRVHCVKDRYAGGGDR